MCTDDDFRALVNKIPVGVTFTFLSDSCHSGGLIDSTKEQIGNTIVSYNSLSSHADAGGSLSGLASKGLDAALGGDEGEPEKKSGFRGFLSKAKAKIKDHASHRAGADAGDRGDTPATENFDFESQYLQETGQQVKSKNLDINTLTEILSQRTGHEVKIGNIRTTIFDMFGEDASPKVKTFVNVILTQLQVSLVLLQSINKILNIGIAGCELYRVIILTPWLVWPTERRCGSRRTDGHGIRVGCPVPEIEAGFGVA